MKDDMINAENSPATGEKRDFVAKKRKKEGKIYSPYEKDPYGLKLKEGALKTGSRLLIPIQYLIGTQRADGYTSHKKRDVESKLSAGGVNFLLQNPAVLCAVGSKDSMSLFIIDGHHRSFKSPKFGIREIPSLVIGPENLAQILTEMGKPIDKKRLIEELDRSASDAQRSFNERGRIQPYKSVDGAQNIPDLTGIFKPF